MNRNVADYYRQFSSKAAVFDFDPRVGKVAVELADQVDEDDDELPPMSAASESTRFSLEDSEGDGLPDDDDDVFEDGDEFDDDLGGDDLEEE